MQTRRKRRRAIRLQKEKERVQKFIDSILSTPTLQKEVIRDMGVDEGASHAIQILKF